MRDMEGKVYKTLCASGEDIFPYVSGYVDMYTWPNKQTASFESPTTPSSASTSKPHA